MKDWQKFENQVAQAYEAMGYLVQQDVHLSGHQIDVLASRTIPGIGLQNICIECKYTDEISVGNKKISQYPALLTLLRQQANVNSFVVVTNKTFSSDARTSVASIPGFHLVTYEELRRSIFDVSDSLISYIENYKNRNIFKSYVDLKINIMHLNNFIYNAVDEIVNVSDSDGSFTTILGDFGSGKTTVLDRVRYFLSIKNTEKLTRRIPVYYKLKDRLQHNTFEEFVEATFRANFQVRTHFELISRQNEIGMFCHLMDGFDEIKSASDESERLDYLSEIAKLSTPSSSIVLTCRPSYFISFSEYEKMRKFGDVEGAAFSKANIIVESDSLRRKYTGTRGYQSISGKYDVFQIKKLTENEIISFLKSRNEEFLDSVNEDWEEVWSFIKKENLISILTSRPILLEMIVDCILERKISLNDADRIYEISSLYQLFTSLVFSRDYYRGEWTRQLTSEQRRRFSQIFACHLFSSNSSSADSNQISKCVYENATYLGIVQREDLSVAQITTDLRVCSFLDMERDGKLQFSHRSFLEYFIAEFIVENIDNLDVVRAANIPLSREIVEFIAGFFWDSSSYCTKARIALQKEAGLTRLVHIHSAMCTAAIRSSDRFYSSGTIISDVQLSPVDVIGRKLSFFNTLNTAMRNSNFVKVDMEDVNFKNGLFNNTNFIDTNMFRVRMESNLVSCKFDSTCIGNCKFDIIGRDNSFIETSVSDTFMRIQSSVNFLNCRFDNTKIISTSNDIDLFRMKFDNCTMKECHVNFIFEGVVKEIAASSPIVNGDFFAEESHLYGLRFSLSDLIAKDAKSGKYVWRNRLERCTGLIYVSGPAYEMIFDIAREANPNLLLFPLALLMEKSEHSDSQKFVNLARSIREEMSKHTDLEARIGGEAYSRIADAVSRWCE